MTHPSTLEISKADVESFLFGKHLTACPVCSRFRSQCNTDVHTISCQRVPTNDAPENMPVNVLMIVCQNCGAIQFHDRTVIAKWLDCQRKFKTGQLDQQVR